MLKEVSYSSVPGSVLRCISLLFNLLDGALEVGIFVISILLIRKQSPESIIDLLNVIQLMRPSAGFCSGLSLGLPRPQFRLKGLLQLLWMLLMDSLSCQPFLTCPLLKGASSPLPHSLCCRVLHMNVSVGGVWRSICLLANWDSSWVHPSLRAVREAGGGLSHDYIIGWLFPSSGPISCCSTNDNPQEIIKRLYINLWFKVGVGNGLRKVMLRQDSGALCHLLAFGTANTFFG